MGCGCKKKINSGNNAPVTVNVTPVNNETNNSGTPIDQQLDSLLKKIDEIKNNEDLNNQ